MKYLELSQGRRTIVDDADYAAIGHLKWSLVDGRYAHNNIVRTYLHRHLLNAPRGTEVDHINGDTLDNRRCNIRLASRSQNMANRTKSQHKTSVYKGVYRIKQNKHKPWIANIKHRVTIGSFATEHQAAMAYDLWAVHVFGDFAKTNNSVVAFG